MKWKIRANEFGSRDFSAHTVCLCVYIYLSLVNLDHSNESPDEWARERASFLILITSRSLMIFLLSPSLFSQKDAVTDIYISKRGLLHAYTRVSIGNRCRIERHVNTSMMHERERAREREQRRSDGKGGYAAAPIYTHTARGSLRADKRHAREFQASVSAGLPTISAIRFRCVSGITIISLLSREISRNGRGTGRVPGSYIIRCEGDGLLLLLFVRIACGSRKGNSGARVYKSHLIKCLSRIML